MLEGAISTPALEEVPKGRPRSTWFDPSLTRKAPAPVEGSDTVSPLDRVELADPSW